MSVLENNLITDTRKIRSAEHWETNFRKVLLNTAKVFYFWGRHSFMFRKIQSSVNNYNYDPINEMLTTCLN